MKINMCKGLGGLRPVNTEDEEKMKSLPMDWEGEVTLRHPRNYQFHKKYFALIKLGFENQEQYNSMDHYRILMQMKAGFYDLVTTDKGVLPIAKSISFSSMEAYEFMDLYSKVLYEISVHLDIGSSKLDEEVQYKLDGFN